MQKQGKEAEIKAIQWLEQQDLQLLETNYFCRFGEIDIIMLDNNMLVFIEVRLRSTSNFGGAASSVTRRKQQKIITTANHFLMCRPQYAKHHWRFDVIAYESSSVQSSPVWYKDAFRT